jgi:choline dehydrogenase-like flavoprotein
MHPNPIQNAETVAFSDRLPGEEIAPGDPPLWGRALKERLAWWFLRVRHLKFEVFAEWLPHRDSRIELDRSVKDRFGLPVARIRAFNHPVGLETVRVLVEQGVRVLRAAGARHPRPVRGFGGPSTNLMAGTCRFGDDPRTSVLDRDCRAHEVENLWVTDGSFLPSGGSVPYTFTIYANALRVAARLRERGA